MTAPGPPGDDIVPAANHDEPGAGPYTYAHSAGAP